MTSNAVTRNDSGVSLEEAVEAITVACALGQEIPAPPGTCVWNAAVKIKVSEPGEAVTFIGTYPTRTAAERAVRNWIMGKWSEKRKILRSDLREYLSVPRTDKEIITCYFDAYQNWQLLLEKVALASVEEPAFTLGGTNLRE